MSSSHYAAFGIYLKCTTHETVETNGFPFCPKDSTHTIHAFSAQFCPICGSRVEHEKTTTKVGWWDMFDIDDDYALDVSEEELELLDHSFFQMGFDGCEENTEYLIPTIDKIFNTGIGGDEGEIEEGEFEVDMSGQIISTDLAEEYMRRQIEILKRVLYSEVEVKFGYISQWG